MTEDEQLDFDALLDEEPKVKKPRRKRAAPKTAVLAIAEEMPAAEPEGDRPPSVTPDTAGPEPASEVAAQPSTTPRLFFLTNRMNLNGLLGSRVLAPRESFHKYYADLLELTPGWVPVLTEPPNTSLIERVVAERGAGAPVLVELSESARGDHAASGSVLYLRAASFSDVTAVHFRDEKSLREHRARTYGNVHPHDELLRVSPELFASASAAEVEIATPDAAPSTNWLQLDRARGAVNAALAAADSGESLAIVAGLLGAPELPPGTLVPPWLTWTALTGDASAPTNELDAETADRLIFQAAYRVLGERDQTESWSPVEVLDAVSADIAQAHPTEEAQRIIGRNLGRVREIVNIERDFEPFRNPGSPYVAVKSFLMVLLRPDLEQLLAWPSEETGADEPTRVVAAVLAGRLRGLTRESVKRRSAAFDDLTAAWAVRVASGGAGDLGSAQLVWDATKTALLLDGAELHTTTRLVPDPVALYGELPEDKRLPARVAVSQQLGWPVEVRVHVPAGADVRTSDSVISIISTEQVKVEALVGEAAFLDQLRRVVGIQRQRVVSALAFNT